MSKNLKEFIISGYKLASMILIGALFFIGFAFQYSSLMVLSRTLAVTLITFAITYILFSKIYGNMQIGEFKSKQVIYSTSLTVFFTDILAYLSLMVMLTNPNNVWANASFRVENLHILLLVFVLQVVLIGFASYLGNYFYFKLFEPKKSIVVYDKDYSQDTKIQEYLNQYRKQYVLVESIEIRDHRIDDVLSECDFVVFAEMDSDVRKNLVEVCYLLDIDFAFTPSVSDVIEMSGVHATYGDKPIVEVRVAALTFNQRVVKRLMDIFVSAVGILITLPLWLVFVIAIKLDDNGPIFFRQTRKTVNGNEFKVFKFRSMKVDSANVSVSSDDDRITRVGKVLRKIRLDELPQLLNILNGDMSLVGPRPEMLENITAYEAEMPEFSYRLKAKAGLTGMAQIEGKYNTLPKDKLILDLIYIENYSIWLDIKLIFKTAIIFFKKDSTEGF